MVETQTYNAFVLWPYGVKGGGHPEGHPGFDFEAPENSEILAVQNGSIISVTTDGGHGIVIIQSVGGITVTYQHIGISNVHNGQKIKQGDVIGFVGYRKDLSVPLAMMHFDVNVPAKVCPLEFFNEEAQNELEYLRQNSQGDEAGYVDQNHHYTNLCF